MKSVFIAASLALLLTTSVGAAPVRNSEAIPPNCTLDPFTGKQVCHIWPTCTLDPFTGKMKCPPPKVRRD
jgi:hypothetical protein